MICSNCGRPNAKVRQISQLLGKGDKTLIIENLPVVDCPDCGAQYFTPEMQDGLDHVLAGRKSLAVKRLVDVVDYEQAVQVNPLEAARAA